MVDTRKSSAEKYSFTPNVSSNAFAGKAVEITAWAHLLGSYSFPFSPCVATDTKCVESKISNKDVLKTSVIQSHFNYWDIRRGEFKIV